MPPTVSATVGTAFSSSGAGEGSRITYIETVERVNYVPHWLQPWIRPIFTVYLNRADRKQLANLARLAEECSKTGPS
jgi:hypothetical protein